MMEGFTKRSLTWIALFLFAIVLVLQASSYFRLAFSMEANPSNHDDTINTELEDTQVTAPTIMRYERDYQTFWHYLASLALLFVCIALRAHFQRHQSNKEYGMRYCRIRYLLEYEYRLLDMRLSLSSTLSMTGLVVLNAFHVLVRDRVLVSEHRDLYHQEYANRFAQLAVVNMAVAIALSVRHISTYPNNLQWHLWFASMGGMCALYHACFQLSRNYTRHGDIMHTLFSNVRYTTGTMMATALILLVFGSHSLVRHASYRFFRISHLGAFAVLIAVGYLHHWAFGLIYMAAGFMWLRDQYWQYVNTAPARVVGLKALPGNIIKLQVHPAFQIPDQHPSQFAFVSWGSSSWMASKVYAHPFSISRFDRDTIDDTLTFYIRASGRNTLSLHEMAIAGERPSHLRISAPLGHPELENGQQFADFQVVVLVAEGVGITPWISVIQQLGQTDERIKTKRIIVLWTMRNTDTLHAMVDELANVNCTLRVYTTRQPEPDMEEGFDIRYGRPNYANEFDKIRQEYPNTHVALGLCAHGDTMRQCGNIARLHSHPESIWFLKQERFEL
ncbi:hypothetical protein K492DRAFT_236413 [Lichtheimia hyalospora FSU 10163]|nr:hypothetical protein K492DRAFT_236413 [Lichtheimia hyalospora FSU 10163]